MNGKNKFVFKARASQVYKIMSNPRSKSELLSKTAMDCLEQAYKEWKYNRTSFISTPAMEKGIECENEAVFVYNKAKNTAYKKSVYHGKDRMENDWCTGHEDIDGGDYTIDLKTCKDFGTFPIFFTQVEKDYRWQGQAYMMLKGEQYKYHKVAKVLVNTPLRQIRNELYNINWRLQKKYEDIETVDKEYEKMAWEYFKNNVYDKQVKVESNGEILQLTDDLVIPYEDRVVELRIDRDDTAIEQLKERVSYINNIVIPELF